MLIFRTLNCHLIFNTTVCIQVYKVYKNHVSFTLLPSMYTHTHTHTHTDSQLDLSLFKFLQRVLSVARRESGGELSSVNSTKELHQKIKPEE